MALVTSLAAFAALSHVACAQRGSAGEAEREELLQAVRDYWETGRSYNLGFASGVGELRYAEIRGEEAEVKVDIIIGYTRPTDGAGYKETVFRLHEVGGSWRVTYDGWADLDVAET